MSGFARAVVGDRTCCSLATGATQHTQHGGGNCFRQTDFNVTSPHFAEVYISPSLKASDVRIEPIGSGVARQHGLGGQTRRSGGQKSPSPGAEPRWGLGAKPPEAEEKSAK